jgi:hypothetical protein
MNGSSPVGRLGPATWFESVFLPAVRGDQIASRTPAFMALVTTVVQMDS